MPTERTQRIVACALKVLSKHGVPLYKVVVQKFLYFLEYQGANTGLRFKPFTYGPYSFELTEVLDDMHFWGKISVHGKSYEINDLDEFLEVEDPSPLIEGIFDQFSDACGGKYDFQSMERLGTVLYCAKTLESLGDEVTEDAVVNDFIGWKGDKYREQEIRASFKSLARFLHSN